MDVSTSLLTVVAGVVDGIVDALDMSIALDICYTAGSVHGLHGVVGV